jgi:flagellar motor switch protein FliM
MSKILTQAEIEALVAAGAPAASDVVNGHAPAGPVRAYNFRRPDRVAKDQLRSLRVMHERWAKGFATALSAFLRAPVDLAVVSIDQLTYAECVSSFADPTAFYALSLAPFEDAGALEINPQVAFALVDRLLGGGGRAVVQNRPLTAIELKMLDGCVDRWLASLTEAWTPVAEATFAVRGRETEPAMLQVAAPDAVFVVVGIDTRIGDSQGLVNLCLPVSLVESGRGASAGNWRRQQPAISPVERNWMHDNLGRVPLSVSPFLETRLAGRDVLALQPGDVVSLGVALGDPIDVRVGGVKKLRGRLAARQTHAELHIVGNPLSA